MNFFEDCDVFVLGIGAAGVLACALLGSCVHDYMKSTPDVIEVTIVDKHFSPGHYDTSCSTDGKGHISCDTDWVPPSWTVTYEDTDYQDRVTVSEGTYSSLKLGDRKPIRFYTGGGYWHARYDVKFLLGPLSPEKGMPVR